MKVQDLQKHILSIKKFGTIDNEGLNLLKDLKLDSIKCILSEVSPEGNVTNIFFEGSGLLSSDEVSPLELTSWYLIFLSSLYGISFDKDIRVRCLYLVNSFLLESLSKIKCPYGGYFSRPNINYCYALSQDNILLLIALKKWKKTNLNSKDLMSINSTKDIFKANISKHISRCLALLNNCIVGEEDNRYIGLGVEYDPCEDTKSFPIQIEGDIVLSANENISDRNGYVYKGKNYFSDKKLIVSPISSLLLISTYPNIVDKIFGERYFSLKLLSRSIKVFKDLSLFNVYPYISSPLAKKLFIYAFESVSKYYDESKYLQKFLSKYSLNMIPESMETKENIDICEIYGYRDIDIHFTLNYLKE